jgi:hypothetical protein
VALNPRSVLSISLLDGFNQTLGDTFTMLDYSSLVGQFANSFIFFDDGFAWDVSYGAQSFCANAQGISHAPSPPVPSS